MAQILVVVVVVVVGGGGGGSTWHLVSLKYGSVPLGLRRPPNHPNPLCLKNWWYRLLFSVFSSICRGDVCNNCPYY